MSSPSLADLPSELLSHIFTFLPSQSVISCLRVNQRFNRIIEENRKLMAKKCVKLDLDGREENKMIVILNSGFEFCESLDLVFVDSAQETHGEKEAKDITIQYLNNHNIRLEDGQPGFTIKTVDVHDALRKTLTFIAERSNIDILSPWALSPEPLHIVAEVLSSTRCYVRQLNLFDYGFTLNDGLSQIIERAGEGVEIRGYGDCDLEILSLESVTKLGSVQFCPHRIKPLNVGSYVTKLQATNIEISVFCHIMDRDLAEFVQQWSLGLRTIDYYTSHVKCDQDLIEYIEKLPNITVESGNESNIMTLSRSLDGAKLRLECRTTGQEEIFSVHIEDPLKSQRILNH